MDSRYGITNCRIRWTDCIQHTMKAVTMRICEMRTLVSHRESFFEFPAGESGSKQITDQKTCMPPAAYFCRLPA